VVPVPPARIRVWAEVPGQLRAPGNRNVYFTSLDTTGRSGAETDLPDFTRRSMGLDLSFKSMTGNLSLITRWIYFAIAIVLSLLSLLSLVDVARGFLRIGEAPTLTSGILSILHAVLLTIIIVEILETVIVAFKTNRVLVRPILIAGLTAMVRRILFYGVEAIQPVDLLVDAVVIAVLTAAVVVIGKEESLEMKGS
jgi:uncharacterized membrane protein (DUF373 family)